MPLSDLEQQYYQASAVLPTVPTKISRHCGYSFSLLRICEINEALLLKMWAVPRMTFFCNYTEECLPGMSSGCYWNDSDKLSVAPVIIGVTFAFTFHMRCVWIGVLLFTPLHFIHLALWQRQLVNMPLLYFSVLCRICCTVPIIIIIIILVLGCNWPYLAIFKHVNKWIELNYYYYLLPYVAPDFLWHI
jgi:hypothetical protein